MKQLHHLNLEGKRVLLRVDFNVPLDQDYNVTDDTRIQASLPTIKLLKEKGAKIIILAHFGRPKGLVNLEFSLQPVRAHLETMLDESVVFIQDVLQDTAVDQSLSLQNGQIALCENIRFYPGEEKGNPEFAAHLAQLGDIYVNDAFGAAHREHASTAVVAKHFPGNSFFGLLMDAEVAALDKIFSEGKSPVTAVVGGAKVSSKIDILKNLMPKVDHIIIGGGMAYTFLLAKGGKVGNSLVESDKTDLALEILEEAQNNNVVIHLPVDSKNAGTFSNDATSEITAADAVSDGYMGLDIGPKTIGLYSVVLSASKTILWNGPMGVFEFENFSEGTKAIGKAIGKASKFGAFSLVGGGDSVAAVKQFGLEDEVSYVSTGGGAMLEYLEGKVLPGIAAIRNQS